MKIVIKNEFPHDWVTRIAGEKLRKLIISGLVNEKVEVEVDFAGMTIASVSFFDEGIAKLAEEDLPKDWKKKLILSNLNPWDKEVLDVVTKQRKIEVPVSLEAKKSHPWRICPVGEHFVRAHDKKSKKGTIGHWDSQCRKNPSGKEIYTTDEINKISEVFSKTKLKMPNLFEKESWNRFDELIAGWTQFWNDTFNPSEPLPVNYVKALIASESSFITSSTNSTSKKKKVGKAQGLVQLTEETTKLLSHSKKELSDHFFDISQGDIFDPNVNVCAAIRWLFRKKEIAQVRLKRIPTWYEVMLEYKGILNDKSKEAVKQQTNLQDQLHKLGEIF